MPLVCYTKISKIFPKMLPVKDCVFYTIVHCVFAISRFKKKKKQFLRALFQSLILANDNRKCAITKIREERDLFDPCTTFPPHTSEQFNIEGVPVDLTLILFTYLGGYFPVRVSSPHVHTEAV